jgi:Ca-activated chloride channel family protein
MPYIANNIYDSTFSQKQTDAFSLIADTDEADILKLPLRAIDVRFQITGAVVKVSIQQLYEYDGDQPVDVTYQFPLPASASVYECKMKLGEKEIEAQVKPEKEADKIFTEQKNAGHRVAKMESVRENLFNLRMGNVQPGDSPIITVSYIQTIECIGAKRQLRIPTCQGIRFVPGIPEGIDGATDIVPDAGKLITPRISSDHPEVATLFCAGSYIGQNNAIDFKSPTHCINVQNEGAVYEIMLGNELDIPDGDIVLQWMEDSDSKVILELESEYGLLTVKAPDYPKAVKRYVHFLLDASGSMRGENWNSLITGLENTLKLLPQGTQIGVTLFSSDSIKITEESPFVIGEDKISDLLSNIQESFSGGGTNFTPAFIKTVGNLMASRDNPALVIITDGQFADEARASTEASKAGIEIHCVGIDSYVNDHALQSIARRANGTCILMQPGEEMIDAMNVLANRLSRVAVKEVRIDGFNIHNMPRIYPNDTAIIPFKRNNESINTSPEICFVLSDESEIELDLKISKCENAKLEKIYAKDQITHLIDQNENKAAIDLACNNNITCQGTTWIAYDQSVKVEVSSAILSQPSLLSENLNSERYERSKKMKSFRVNYESARIMEKRSISFSMSDVDEYLCADNEAVCCESIDKEHTYQKKLQHDNQGSRLNKLFYILISDLKDKFKDLQPDQWRIIENKLMYIFKSSVKEHQVLDFLDRSKKLASGKMFLLAVKDFKEHASALSSLKFQGPAKFRCYEEALFYLSEVGSKAKLTKSEVGEYKYTISLL